MRPRPEATGAYLRELGLRLSDEQLGIVTHPLAPQLVVAGAGSGKTTVMAARVVHLVAFHGLTPSAVLGLTFTNKAAGALSSRVRAALAVLGLDRPVEPGAEAPDDQPTVSTYHAYAARLFGDHALRIGREPLTRLVTDATRWQLASSVVRSATGPFRHLEVQPQTVTGYLLDLDAEMSEHLASAASVGECDAELRRAVAAVEAPTADVRKVAAAAGARDELLTLVEQYRRRKLDADLLDYGDQVALAAEVASRCPEVGSIERERYAAVLLDEYQDTGVAQRVLLTQLFGRGHPVTAVGDPCQSIYGWRGASVGNLLRFPEHFPGSAGAAGRPQYLMTSFRSGGRLLAVANAVSEPLRTPQPGARRPDLGVPVLAPAPETEQAGETLCSLHLTVEDEAAWVAAEVVRAVAEGTPPGEVAVLCRWRRDFAPLHQALVAAGLPVEVVGLGGLLEMPEVADVVATLEVLAEPTANPALVRLLTGPRWRIGPRDLVALGRRAEQLSAAGDPDRGPDGDDDPDGRRALAAATKGADPCDVVSLSEALERPGVEQRYSPEAVRRFRRLALELRELRAVLSQPVVEAVATVIRTIGLDVEVEAAPGPLATSGMAHLAAFLDHAARFVAIEGESDLTAFLAFLAAARDAENALDPGGISATDSVKLLTVHKAKGLEWEVVAVPGLVTGGFPTDRGRPRWTTGAAVLPYRLRGDCADLPADPQLTNAGLSDFVERCRDEALAEERRLAYVAVTRARRRLLASGAWWGATQLKAREPSPFLREIRTACLAGAGSVDRWASEPGADNPLLSGTVDVTWPAPYQPVPRAARQRAAALVREYLASPVEAAAGPRVALSDAEAAAARGWSAEVDLLLAELSASGSDRLVELPRALTTSQVVQLADDPAGLARCLARPMPRRPSAAARRGTRFHAWVEHLFGERPLFDPGAIPGAGDADLPDDADLAALQEAFQQSVYGGVKPYRVEAGFELVLAGRLVRGRIDAVYQTERGFDVIDYKTGLRPRHPRAAALQLAVYRVAWAGIAEVPVDRVDAGFLYVQTGEIVRPELPGAEGLAGLLAGTAG